MVDARLGRALILAGLLAMLVGPIPGTRAIALPAYPPHPGGSGLHGTGVGPPTPSMRSSRTGTPFPSPPPSSIWTNLSSSPTVRGPGPKYGAGLAYDAADGYSVLFGGLTPSDRPYLNDTWEWKSGAWTNISRSSAGTITGAPVGRLFPAFAYDPEISKIVLFGGYSVPAAGGPRFLNDTWTFSHGVWTNITAQVGPSPEGRWAASMAYDGTSRSLVLFGGGIGGVATGSGSTAQRETWTFHAGNWTNRTGILGAAQPPARDEAAMAWDNASADLVLYGGEDAHHQLLDDTWIYSAGNWTNVTGWSHIVPVGTPSGALAGLRGATLTPDSDDGTLLLFGGSDYAGPTFVEASNASYLYVHRNWTEVSPYVGTPPEGIDLLGGNPNGPYAASATWDNATGAVLVFGGQQVYTNHSSGISNYTWAYRWSNLTTGLSANRTEVPFGQGFNLTATTRGGTWTYRWSYAGLPPGCVSADQAELSCTPADAGPYRVSVFGNDSLGATSEANLSVDVYLPVSPRLSIWPGHVDLGSAVDVNTTTTGGAAGPLRYSFSGLPSICSPADSAAFACAADASGTYRVNVTVEDSQGNRRTAGPAQFIVHPRLLLTLEASAGAVEDGQRLELTATPGGGFGPYHFQWSGLPTGCPSVDSGQLNCTPAMAAPGTYAISVTLNDSTPWGRSVSTPVDVFAKLSAAIGSTEVGSTAGRSYRFDAELVGGAPPVNTSWLVTAPGLPTVSETAQSSISLTAPARGNYSIRLWANDSLQAGAFAETNESLGGSGAPLLVAIAVAPSVGAVDLGESVILTAAATGGSPGDSGYGFSWTFSAPCNAAGAVLTCRPTATGSFSVTATANDSAGDVGSANRSVTAEPRLGLALSLAPSAGCGSGVASLTAQPSGGLAPYVIHWTYPGNNGGTGATGSFYLGEPGSYPVSASVTDATGARNGSSALVAVPACPGVVGLSSIAVLATGGGAAALALAAVLVVAYRRRRDRARAEPDPEATDPSEPEADGP